MGTTGAGRLAAMHARSALFDVYGDHLRTRGHRAAVADLVRLLAPIGIAAPAVRTAISRMVAQGWLEPAAVAGARGYAATPQAIRRLEEAAAAHLPAPRRQWDGCWQLLLLDPFPSRAVRATVLRRPAVPRVRRAGRPRVGQPVGPRRPRRDAAARRCHGDHRPGAGLRPAGLPGPGVGPRRHRDRLRGVAGRGGRRPSRPTSRRTRTRRRRRSPPASTWSTSGASSSSPTRGCRSSCSPRTGPGDGPATTSGARPTGSPRRPRPSWPGPWRPPDRADCGHVLLADLDRPRPARRRRRRRHDHPQPSRRHERPRRGHQGAAARHRAAGGARTPRCAAWCSPAAAARSASARTSRSTSPGCAATRASRSRRPSRCTTTPPSWRWHHAQARGRGGQRGRRRRRRQPGLRRRLPGAGGLGGLQHLVRRRRAVLRHRGELDPAAPGRPGHGDGAALLPPHRPGRRRPSSSAWPPGWCPPRTSPARSRELAPAAGRGADGGLRLDPPGGRALVVALLRGVAGLRGGRRWPSPAAPRTTSPPSTRSWPRRSRPSAAAEGPPALVPLGISRRIHVATARRRPQDPRGQRGRRAGRACPVRPRSECPVGGAHGSARSAGAAGPEHAEQLARRLDGHPVARGRAPYSMVRAAPGSGRCTSWSWCRGRARRSREWSWAGAGRGPVGGRSGRPWCRCPRRRVAGGSSAPGAGARRAGRPSPRGSRARWPGRGPDS